MSDPDDAEENNSGGNIRDFRQALGIRKGLWGYLSGARFCASHAGLSDEDVWASARIDTVQLPP